MSTESAQSGSEALGGVIPFDFGSSDHNHTHAYLWPAIMALAGSVGPGVRVLDVGCGKGLLSSRFASMGCTVVGIDASVSGIEAARRASPGSRWEVMLADADVLAKLNEPPFDIVLSTEVVEHLYDPRAYMRGCVAALKPGGKCVISTPFHGYVKNLLISLTNGWDSHANPMWDGGHIKLFSRRRLTELLTEAGLRDPKFVGAGRFAPVWMSMVMSAVKP